MTVRFANGLSWRVRDEPDQLHDDRGQVDAGGVAAYGAAEYVDMKLYLMWRARGMKVETPAVRP